MPAIETPVLGIKGADLKNVAMQYFLCAAAVNPVVTFSATLMLQCS